RPESSSEPSSTAISSKRWNDCEPIESRHSPRVEAALRNGNTTDTCGPDPRLIRMDNAASCLQLFYRVPPLLGQKGRVGENLEGREGYLPGRYPSKNLAQRFDDHRSSLILEVEILQFGHAAFNDQPLTLEVLSVKEDHTDRTVNFD